MQVVIWLSFNMLAGGKYAIKETGTKVRVNFICRNPEKSILNLFLCVFAFCFMIQVNTCSGEGLLVT